jgi:hypothetical protein
MRNIARSKLLTLLALTVLSGAALADTAEEPEALFSDEIVVVGDPVYLVPVPPDKAFEVAFKVGELDIEAQPVSDARLEVRAGCGETPSDVCGEKIARLRLETRDFDDRVRVELTGLSRRQMEKLDVDASIIVPSRAPLIVRMGVGDLDIHAGPEDLDVGMSIGDLTVHAPSEEIGSVGISTRIGDATLRTGHDPTMQGKRRMLIGAKVRWDEGEGDSRIKVRLGIGDAKVRLE